MSYSAIHLVLSRANSEEANQITPLDLNHRNKENISVMIMRDLNFFNICRLLRGVRIMCKMRSVSRKRRVSILNFGPLTDWSWRVRTKWPFSLVTALQTTALITLIIIGMEGEQQ